MPALQITIRPVDSGKTVETAMVNGSIAEGTLLVSDAQSGALNGFLTLVRGGQDTSVIEDVMQLESLTGVAAYIALADPSGADDYIALDDADVLEVVDAAVGLDNMSSAQKAGLLAYIAAIIAEEDTSDVETAIGEIGGE
jgi:hypothetical protein